MHLATPAFARWRSAFDFNAATQNGKAEAQGARHHDDRRQQCHNPSSNPEPQTTREVIQANADLLIEPPESGYSEALTAMGRFQLTYKLKITERVKAKCKHHPRYNSERDGRGGIRGGCSTCFSLFYLGLWVLLPHSRAWA